MEATVMSKFCRVCLAPEDIDESFVSIFKNNGKIASMMYKISGVPLIDVDKDYPGSVCTSCLNDIEQSYALRQRILDANDHYESLAGSLSSKREKLMFTRNLLELKKTSSNKVNGKFQEQHSELRKFFVPTVYLNRNKLNDPDNLLSVSPVKTSRSIVRPTKSVIPMMSQKPLFTASPSRPTRSVVVTMPQISPKKSSEKAAATSQLHKLLVGSRKKSPPKRIVQKQSLFKTQAERIIKIQPKPQPKPIDSDEEDDEGQDENITSVMKSKINEGKKRRISNVSLPRQKKEEAIIITCFECDTCKRTFKSSWELNSHIESHELLVDEFLSLFEMIIADPSSVSKACLETTEEPSSSQNAVFLQEDVLSQEDTFILTQEDIPPAQDSPLAQEDVPPSQEVLSSFRADEFLQQLMEEEEEGLLLEEIPSEDEMLLEEVDYPMHVDTDDRDIIFTVREVS